MIELPEAYTLAAQVSGTLARKRITRAQANHSPHKFAWFTGNPEDYSRLLFGAVMGPAVAAGNHVEIQVRCTDRDRFLAISTPIRYHPAGEKLPAKHQLMLEFDDHSTLTCTVQMWGAVTLFAPGQDPGIPEYAIAKAKPSPLSDAFDRPYFDSLFDAGSGKLSAKEFLATKQRIPGLGNGVLQDLLWTARIHPRTIISTLRPESLDAMYRAVKSVLAKMASCGGRNTERDLFGSPGGYKTSLCNDSFGLPCPVCGTAIVREAYLGGKVYYCAGCQPRR